MADTDFDLIVTWFGMFGIIVFAISGALDAARKELDILGFLLIGSIVGLGGGTIRDLLLGVTPVTWVVEPVYVATCLIAATATYFAVPFIASRKKALVWMDAIGVSTFSVTGTQFALAQDAPPLIAVCMGVMTATFGGIIRDVLCQFSLVLSGRELYVTASLAGATVYLTLMLAGINPNLAMTLGFSIAMILRSGAILKGWKLPAFNGQ